MKEDDILKTIDSLLKAVIGITVLVVLVAGFGWVAYENPYVFKSAEEQETVPSEESVIFVESDFVEGEHKFLVIANCTGCHSGKLVTQNRATREGWTNMIRWMQRTQNLKDLGDAEAKILDYLAKHYAPAEQGRRANLEVGEWYELE